MAREPDPALRARRATQELLRLEQERSDFTAIRDVAIHRLVTAESYSYSMIGSAIGLARDRAAQLVRRAHEVHHRAVQQVSRIKRSG